MGCLTTVAGDWPMSGETCGAGGEGWVGTAGHLRLLCPQAPLRWEGRREGSGIAHLKKILR